MSYNMLRGAAAAANTTAVAVPTGGGNSFWNKENTLSLFPVDRLSDKNIIQKSYESDLDIFNQKWSNSFVAMEKTKQNALAIASFDPTKRSSQEYATAVSKVSC